MPTYTFELRDGSQGITDEVGIPLPTRRHALSYARDITRELMVGREKSTRCWRLDVYENREKILEVPFASVDPTLDHIVPEMRSAIEGFCERRRSWLETICEAHATTQEARALVARCRGKPYLATRSGEPTIRP
jgi:hypothetical protein